MEDVGFALTKQNTEIAKHTVSRCCTGTWFNFDLKKKAANTT